MPQSGKLPVLNLLTGQKSGFSPRSGDSLHRFTSNLATGTWVRLGVQNFISITTGGGNAAPKYQNAHFLVKSHPCGQLPWPISKNLWSFIRPTILHQTFKFDWCDSFHRLRSYCRETARLSIWPNYSMHPVRTTMRLIERWTTAFVMASTNSITVQSMGKIVQRAPAVVRILVARWRHNFREIAVKHCENSKNRRKSVSV